MTRRRVREGDAQSKAIELFEKSFPELKIIRINSGLAKGLRHGFVHLAKEGTPDLLVPHPYLWIEMKRPGGKMKPEQLAWQEWAKANGVPHLVCDTPEDLIAMVRRMREPAMREQPLTADALRQLIGKELTFTSCNDEYGYQEQLEDWLNKTCRVLTSREVVLSPSDRVDFMVDGIAVELKVKCSTNEILRQLERYAQHESVREILLLSVTRAPLLKLPPSLNGKPVRGLHIGRFL